MRDPGAEISGAEISGAGAIEPIRHSVDMEEYDRILLEAGFVFVDDEPENGEETDILLLAGPDVREGLAEEDSRS